MAAALIAALSVCRVSVSHCCVRGAASAVCVPSVRDWYVFFKEIGPSDRQNDKQIPVGSQSSRRLAALGAPGGAQKRARFCWPTVYIFHKSSCFWCTFWERD
jgi:hypothetical protein